MQYALLIYSDEAVEAAMSEDEMGVMMAQYAAFTQAVRESGVLVDGNPLQPTMTATTVRVRDGRVTPQDGPYAETKEQLGGYYVLECADLDEALAWAAKIPAAASGAVEVRPVFDFGSAMPG